MYSISPPNGKSQNQNHLFDKPPLLNPPPLNLKPQKTLHLDLSLLWIRVPKSNFKVYFNAKETKKRVGSTEDHGGKKHIENCRNQWITDNKPFICLILNIYIYIYIYMNYVLLGLIFLSFEENPGKKFVWSCPWFWLFFV